MKTTNIECKRYCPPIAQPSHRENDEKWDESSCPEYQIAKEVQQTNPPLVEESPSPWYPEYPHLD